MAGEIRTILVPVDFSVNTEIAIGKAIGFIGESPVVIHLLHVLKPRRRGAGKFVAWLAEKQMQDCKALFLAQHGSAIVKTHILKGASIQTMILECAAMVKPDLIIVGTHTDHRWWSFFRAVRPNALAQSSKCPVLTAKPGSIRERTRLILIPIRHYFPERKLDMGVLLAKKYKARVHLLAIQENNQTEDHELSAIFLRAYNHVREKLQHPVEYSTITRHNAARASIAYAERIMADLILVNPGTESSIFSLAGNGHISDLLSKDSKIQILDIQPNCL